MNVQRFNEDIKEASAGPKSSIKSVFSLHSVAPSRNAQQAKSVFSNKQINKKFQKYEKNKKEEAEAVHENQRQLI